MIFIPLNFVLFRTIAARQGVDDVESTRLGLIGSMMPGGIVTGAVVTQAIAQREAAAAAATATSSTPSSAPPGLPSATTQVQVPDLIGASFDLATSVLKGMQLGFQRQDVISTTVRKDLVTGQFPQAGTMVAQNTAVLLGVSLGFKVPNVTGQPYSIAESTLNALHLQVKRAEQRSTTVPQDSVISQDPLPDSPCSAGDTVTLTTSVGSAVDLPSVKGLLYSDAREKLQDLDFIILEPDYVDSKDPKDTVVGQEPDPGPVPAETKVMLHLSNGKPPVS